MASVGAVVAVVVVEYHRSLRMTFISARTACGRGAHGVHGMGVLNHRYGWLSRGNYGGGDW